MKYASNNIRNILIAGQMPAKLQGSVLCKLTLGELSPQKKQAPRCRTQVRCRGCFRCKAYDFMVCCRCRFGGDQVLSALQVVMLPYQLAEPFHGVNQA